MTSPSQPSRRRQRSARVLVACVLLALAVVAVVGAAVVGGSGPLLGAAVLAVLLGATATRITHSELADSRRDAAQDRAEQAQAYRDLTADRVAEQQHYVRRTTATLEGHRSTISGLVEELAGARTEVAEARLAVEREHDRADRAEAEGRLLTGLLDQAEERAAEAIVRLAELEDEHLVLLAELDAERAAWAVSPAMRKRA
ncbi:Chromosome partition protein Smc [Nocardioides aquaticus]|uniref:Chromosome partition protein Smc n=1 Tax=Nocardioides aquaticus TaxID=160826 RepID=A0ABX8ED88_9ACTN|nr:hypothetical protein [Nocardioides aquaticus]QVT78206.1 Chromosome partition protein Smc [Nocardioides aquaticus]